MDPVSSVRKFRASDSFAAAYLEKDKATQTRTRLANRNPVMKSSKPMKPGTHHLRSVRLMDQVRERIQYLHCNLSNEEDKNDSTSGAPIFCGSLTLCQRMKSVRSRGRPSRCSGYSASSEPAPQADPESLWTAKVGYRVSWLVYTRYSTILFSMRLSLILSVLAFSTSSAFALDPRISVTASGNANPVISGITNLPDDTDLMVEISRRHSNFRAQSKAKVASGGFQAGPFSQGDSPLNPGTYIVEVHMPPVPVQSSAVRASIGSSGEKLRGPLVKRGIVGGNAVNYRTTFIVGSGVTNAKADADAKREGEANKHAWFRKSCKDICTISEESARRAGRPSSPGICYETCVADASRPGK